MGLTSDVFSPSLPYFRWSFLKTIAYWATEISYAAVGALVLYEAFHMRSTGDWRTESFD